MAKCIACSARYLKGAPPSPRMCPSCVAESEADSAAERATASDQAELAAELAADAAADAAEAAAAQGVGPVIRHTDFPGGLSMTALEDDSHSYGAPPGNVFGGVLHVFGTYANVTLIACTYQPAARRRPFAVITAVVKDVQRLVTAAQAADPEVYLDENQEPQWVELPDYPGRRYLLVFAPGAAT